MIFIRLSDMKLPSAETSLLLQIRARCAGPSNSLATTKGERFLTRSLRHFAYFVVNTQEP